MRHALGTSCFKKQVQRVEPSLLHALVVVVVGVVVVVVLVAVSILTPKCTYHWSSANSQKESARKREREQDKPQICSFSKNKMNVRDFCFSHYFVQLRVSGRKLDTWKPRPPLKID